MTIEIQIPTSLRSLSGDRARLDVEGTNVGQALTNLNVACPGIGEHILENGRLRRFVNIYDDGEDILLPRWSGHLASGRRESLDSPRGNGGSDRPMGMAFVSATRSQWAARLLGCGLTSRERPPPGGGLLAKSPRDATGCMLP